MDLTLALRSSFIRNYNDFSYDKKELDVDRLTLFMLLDKTEWYVLGSKDKCFTFWINFLIKNFPRNYNKIQNKANK